MTLAQRATVIDGRPEWLPEQEFPFESRFLNIDGHRVHYVDEGAGPILLFVHAGPAWCFVYRDLITLLRNEFRCVALDFPGSGLSEAAEGYRPGLEGASAVLERFLLQLDLRDVTLVAHDLGAPIALGVAARHPDRFRAAAVTEGFGWSLSDENSGMARMLRFVGSPPFRALNRMTNLLARGMSTSFGAGRNLSRDGKRAFRGPFLRREARDNSVTMLRDAATADAYLRGVDHALRTTLSHLPLLLVFGGKSPTVKAGFPDQWKTRFPEARLIVLEGAHHFLQMDEPVAVAEAIKTWHPETIRVTRTSDQAAKAR
jgi:haloalkane dehalogenase